MLAGGRRVRPDLLQGVGRWPAASWRAVIAGTREDWPGGARTLTPRESTREPNGTLAFGAELDHAGDQVWFRTDEDAVGPMPAETPADRGRGQARPVRGGGPRRRPCHQPPANVVAAAAASPSRSPSSATDSTP